MECVKCGSTKPLGVAYADGWITLTMASSTFDDLTQTFCSYKCLAHETVDSAAAEGYMLARTGS